MTLLKNKDLRPGISLLAPLALCLLASCAAETPDATTAAQAEMEFAVGALSRASESDNLRLSPFAVYGDRKLFEIETPMVIMDNVPVSYDQAADGWTYSGTQYWFPKHEHSFVAIYPTSVLEPDNSPAYHNSELSFTYTLPTTADGIVDKTRVVDIVAATHRRLYNDHDAVTPVTFSFGHLLSQINFSLELDDGILNNDEYYKINKLEMTGFSASATINIKPAERLSASQTNDSEIDIITDPEEKGVLTINFEEPVIVYNHAAPVTMFDPDRAIIMLPQTFSVDAPLKITLSYSVNEEAATNEVSSTVSNIAWESAKSYNYKYNLSSGKIVLIINDAEIIGWSKDDDKAADAR